MNEWAREDQDQGQTHQIREMIGTKGRIKMETKAIHSLNKTLKTISISHLRNMDSD
jgi:hypothetical protein